MKKMTFVFVVLCALFTTGNLHAQWVITAAPSVEAVMHMTHLDKVIYYVQMVEQQYQAAMNTYNQVQAAIRAEQRAFENLQGITKAKNFNEMMDWYNRQLEYDRYAERSVQGIEIEIGRGTNGGNTYKLSEIRDIPYAAKDQYVGYWDRQFTEEQKEDMWLTAGMTPANYAYVQTWKAKENALSNDILGRPLLLADENAAADEYRNSLREKVHNPNVAEKGILQAVFEMVTDSNYVQRAEAENTAKFREYEYTRNMLENTPPQKTPPIGSSYNSMEFESISDTTVTARGVDIIKYTSNDRR